MIIPLDLGAPDEETGDRLVKLRGGGWAREQWMRLWVQNESCMRRETIGKRWEVQDESMGCFQELTTFNNPKNMQHDSTAWNLSPVSRRWLRRSEWTWTPLANSSTQKMGLAVPDGPRWSQMVQYYQNLSESIRTESLKSYGSLILLAYLWPLQHLIVLQ